MSRGPGRRRRAAARCARCAINLRARGYEVDAAPRRRRRRCELAAASHPDVVVLDLGLPDMDGIEVITRPPRLDRVPIIVLSARPTPTRRSRRSTPAPTTTSPSRSAWTSCWPGCAPRSAGPHRRPTARTGVVEHRRLHRRPGRQAGHARRRRRAAHAHRVAAAGGAGPQRRPAGQPDAAAAGGLGSARTSTETNYLRVYMAQLRRKLEPGPRAARGTSSPSRAWATASNSDQAVALTRCQQSPVPFGRHDGLRFDAHPCEHPQRTTRPAQRPSSARSASCSATSAPARSTPSRRCSTPSDPHPVPVSHGQRLRGRLADLLVGHDHRHAHLRARS